METVFVADYRLIACEIAQPEFDWILGRLDAGFDVEYLPQGYHNDVVTGRRVIQECIDRADGMEYKHIILGYALCNNMLVGIKAGTTPLVIARAHDCITWFLGSKERYRSEFDGNPGTYYYTAGWLGIRDNGGQGTQGDQQYDDPQKSGSGIGVSDTYEELVEKYGEDNAKYLWEMNSAWTKNYHYGTYIDLPCTDPEPCRKRVNDICRQNSWQYREMPGDLSLLERWLDGSWNREDFLIVSPGSTIMPTFDSSLISIARSPGA